MFLKYGSGVLGRPHERTFTFYKKYGTLSWDSGQILMDDITKVRVLLICQVDSR